MRKECVEKYNELVKEYNELSVKKATIEAEIARTLVEIARLSIYPFTEGQLVKCVVAMGRTKKERICQIEISDDGQVWVRPCGDDGKLSVRRFKVYPDDNNSYDSVFKEVDR